MNILIINGNPDPAPERLSGALAKAYAEGAESAGHHVRCIEIGTLEFPMIRRAAEFSTEPRDWAITDARAQILWATHLVFIYPLWLGSPPALLKAFMEQVARNEFALGTASRGFPTGKLKGRSARVIVTMGMPAFVYRLWFGAHGVKGFNSGILEISGIRPVATTYLGGITPGRCDALVNRAHRMGQKAR